MASNVEPEKGEARCPGAPSTQDIIAADTVPAPAWVRSESYRFLGDRDIPTGRYIDPAYAQREFDRLVFPPHFMEIHQGGEHPLRGMGETSLTGRRA